MLYIPHESLNVEWVDKDKGLILSLPWISMEIDVNSQDKEWVKEATDKLHSYPVNHNVQKFIHNIKDYPIYSIQSRNLQDFKYEDLQPCPDLEVDTTTPFSLIETFGCTLPNSLKEKLIKTWAWDHQKIINMALIPGTDLYDPISFISYLICYRLEWESTSWSGQDGLGKFLEDLLAKDESQFFQAIGYITKQSWYVTMESAHAMEPALVHFYKAKKLISEFIKDEAGHHKFMEQVCEDIGVDINSFLVADETKWMLASFRRAAMISPLTFSAMVNLFEAAFYIDQDPLSRVLRLSSKPDAAKGYELHYKINLEHHHNDMPVHLAAYLAPQSKSHMLLTLGLFEITLNLLDDMEKKLHRILV